MREPYTQLYIHLAWSTYERLPLITPDIQARLYAAIQAECKKLKVEMIEIGGIDDHVHLLTRIPTTISIAQLAKQIKGASSHLMNHEINTKELFRWQEGYGAFSISKSLVASVRSYIKNQERHHRDDTLHKDLETMAMDDVISE